MESVTNIREDAFFNCYYLTSINIPNSVTSIIIDIFSGCKSLKTIYLEKGIKEEIKEEIKEQLKEEEIEIDIVEK